MKLALPIIHVFGIIRLLRTILTNGIKRNALAAITIVGLSSLLLPNSGLSQPCTWSGPSNQQSASGGIGAPPCGSTGSVSNVGSGTYTYLTLTGGHSYQFGSCGTSFDNQLSLWYYTGSGNFQGNNGGWAPVGWNDNNGPACSGNQASFNYDAYATSGNYILIMNQNNCAQYTGGTSAVLTYRENGLPSLTATPTNACVSPGCNGSVALSMGGTCQTHNLVTGMFEQWNTINTSIASSAYNGRWTESGSIVGNVDGSGQAYFTGNNNWTGGLWSTSSVTPSEGLTLYGRWFNTGSYSMVGWHDNTSGNSYSNLVYAFYPYNSGGLQIYESGNYVGDFTSTNASGIIGLNKWIEFKIVLHSQSAGNYGATYYLRNYTGNMSDPWQEIYQSSASSAGQTLRAGAAVYSSGVNFYLDDIFMGGGTQFPATSGLCAGTYVYAAQDQFGNVSEATATVNNDALSSYGTLNNAGPIQYCDASGNYGPAVSISGYTGTPTWYFGWSNCGICSGAWVGGASAGTCCFPPKVSASDANADRIMVQVKNGQCPAVNSPVVLLQNKYNAAPTSLASSVSSYCSNAVPATITLTATFPSATNILGNVEFATSCGGTPVATVAGNGTTTVSATITAPSSTTTYYVRYNPGANTAGYTSCSATSCVATTVTVNTALGISSVTLNSGSNPTCAGSTATILANGISGTSATLTWYTGPNATGTNLGSSNPLTVGGDQTYYAYVTGVCPAVQASYTLSTTTAAPSITAPAAISGYTSPNNSCAAAQTFAAPTGTDGCTGEWSGNFNLASSSGPLAAVAGNLKFWVKADAGVVKDASGNVAEWRDISGNSGGNKFYQPTFSARPVKTASSTLFNGLPVITFSSTSQYMPQVTSLDGGANSNYTIFVVDRLNGGTNSRLVSSASTNWLMGNWGGYQEQFYCNSWIYGAGASPATTTAPDALPHMYEIVSNSTTGSGTSVYDYGNLVATGTASAPNGPGQLQLNGWNNGASETSTGEVAEIIYYNTILTAAQRQIVEGYLAYKYNLLCPLASKQAYQTFAAATTEGFIASDQSANTAATTSTASVTAYPGPNNITITNPTNCAGSSTTTFSVANGLAPAGNYLNAQNSADLLLSNSNITIGSNWTIESWVKFPLPANGAGGWNTLFRGTNYHHIIVERTTNSTGLILGCYYAGFYPCSAVGTVNGAQGFDVSTLSSGWHHVAAVGTGGYTNFFIDGVFVGKSAAQPTDPLVAIGNYQGGSQPSGAMDEVKIYNVALGQNVISNTMTQASTASSDPNWNNLVAYYKMDGSGANSATGSSACSACSAALQGAATYNTATAFYTYNWSGPGSAVFSPAATTTAESVTLTNAQVANSGTYSVYATANGCNSQTTNSATVTISNTAPGITAPAAINNYNSPNNSCAAAQTFAAPVVTAGCSAAAGNFNLASASGPLAAVSSNLKLWCKGDAGVVKDASGNVMQWLDISGNGNKFTQATAAYRPVLTTSSASFNGYPVITLASTPQYLSLANSLDGGANSTYTMFVVDRMNGGSNYRLCSSTSTNWLFGNWSGAEEKCYCNNWITSSAGSPASDTWAHLYELSSNSNNSGGTNFYDYGVLQANGTAGTPNGPGVLQLSGYSGLSENSTGDVAEIIYYNTILTTAQRQVVEGYLAYKYNLPCPLASAQAYQTYAASTTIGFIAADQNANTATTTQVASVSSYPGPSVAITNPTVCQGSSTAVLSTSGMAPAGYSLTTGANSSNYLLVGTSAYVSNVTIGTNWTEMAWVKFPLPANPSWNTLFRGQVQHHIIVERSQGATNAGLLLGTFNSGFYPCTGSSTVNGVNIAGNTALTQSLDVSTLSNGWHHIAAVGTGGITYFYVDGVLMGHALTQVTNDNVCAIGNYQGGNQDMGTVDEVKIYNTALSQNTISNLMTRASTSSSDPNWNNLVAYYKMDASPVVNSATGSAAACSSCNGTVQGSATVGATATAYYTYNWSGSGSPTFSPAASTIAESVTLTNAQPGNSGTFTVSATANGCSSQATTTGTITVTPSVTINAFSPTSATRCQGAGTVTTTTTASNSTGITYSLDATTAAFSGNSINSATGAVTYAAGWSGTTTITASAAGCNGPVTTTFTETTTPTVTINAFAPTSATRCQGAGTVTTTTTAGNTTGITYSLDVTTAAFSGNSINSATGAVTYAAGWSGTTTITASAAGCNGPVTTTFTETTTPTVTINAFAPTSATRCQGAGTVTTTTTAGNSTGITYSLDATTAAFSGNSIVAATGAVTYAAGWSGTTTVTASAAGCNGPVTTTFTETTTPTVTINPFAPTSATRCQGAGTVTTTATANNTTGITYSLDATTATFSGNSIVAATGAVTYAAGWSGTTTVTASAAGCNGPVTTTFTETTTPTVTINAFAPTSATRCQGAGTVTTTTTAGNSTGITYSLDATTAAFSGNSIVAATGAVTYAAGWSGTTTVTASAAGCNGPVTTTFTETTTPTVTINPFAPTSATRCQGAGTVTTTTTAGNTTGITYSLDATTAAFSGNSIVAATGAVTYAAGWSGTTTITASAAGCNGPVTKTFIETTTPTVTINPFAPTTATRCQGAGTVTTTTTAVNSTGITYSLDATTAAFSGNSIVAATGAVTYAAGWSGTTTITASAAGCNGPVTTTFTETTTPTVTINPFAPTSATRCQGAGTVTTTTTGTNSTGITYSLDATTAAFSGNSIIAATGAVTYAAGWSGTTTVTASAAGCNGPLTTTFTETTTPTVTINPFAPTSATRCQGAGTVTTTTTATNSTGVTYSLDATTAAFSGNSIVAATGAITYAAGWSGTTTVTASAAGCNGPVTTTFTETTTPTVTINPFAPISATRCQGAGTVTTTTTANNSTGITYSLDATTAAFSGNSIVAATGAVTYAAGWSGTTTVTASAAGCNGPVTTTFTETVTPTVTINAFAPTSATRCQGAGTVTTTTTATNSTSITYSLDATTAAFSGNSIVAATGAVTYAAGWSGTTTITASAAGCNGPVTKTFTETTTPTVTINPFAPTSATRCQGAATVTTTTTATNSTGITYSLDATTAAFTGNSIVAATGAVTYAAGWSGTTTVTASAAGCNGPVTTAFTETTTPTVTINPFAPTSATRCQGAGTVTTTTTAVNSTGITYSLDATTAAFSGNSIVAATGAVTYAAGWSGTTTITASAAGCNGPVTTTFVETINPNMAVTSVSGNTPLCISATATYTANGVVLGGLGSGVWSSSNTPVATVSSTGVVTGAAAGTANIIYTISGGCGTNASAQQTVTISPNASVASVSGTPALCIGGTATYTTGTIVLSGGTGAWSSSNTSVATVNSSGLVTGGSTTGTANIIYTVTGGCGGTASAQQTVTIDPAVSSYGTIAASVASAQSLCANVTPSGTFTVTGAAGGSGSFNYQWYYQNGIATAPSGTSTTGWTACTATQGSGYNTATFAPVGTSASISYACFVSPASAPACVGSPTWAGGVLQMTVSLPTAAITGGNLAACTGYGVTLTASTSYVATWQWQSSPDNLSYTNISGATNTTYTAPTSAAGVAYYHAVATYSGGSGCTPATSNNEVVTINAQPAVGSTTGASVCTSGTAALAVTVTGGTSLGYQWEYSTDGGNTWNNVSNNTPTGITYSGNTTASLSAAVSSSTATGSYIYRSYVSDAGLGCTVSSPAYGSATLVVATQPAVTALSNTNICAGGTGTFTVTASGGIGNATGYTWQYYNGSTWAPVTNGVPANITYSVSSNGETSTLSVITTSGVTTGTGFQYQCVAAFNGSGCASTVTSSTGTVTVYALPVVTSQPGTTQLCQNGTGSLTLGFTGGFGATYQWKYFNGVTYVNVAGNTPTGVTYGTSGTANPLNLAASGTAQTGTFNYKLTVSFTGNGCPSSITSNAGSVLIASPPAITIQPAATTNICAGNNATLNVGTSGGVFLTNEWQYYNGTTWNDVVSGTPAGITYSGSGSLTLTTTNGTVTPGSYLYRVIVNSAGNNCNPVTSGTATVVVTAIPTSFTPTVSVNPTCVGAATAIQVAGSQTGINYQLQTSTGANVGTAVAGTGGTINLPIGSLTATTDYQVVATTVTGGCTYNSNLGGVTPTTVVAVAPDIALGGQIAANHFAFGTTSGTIPTNWTNTANTDGTVWITAHNNPASANNYSYYNASGNSTAASTGYYIETPQVSTAAQAANYMELVTSGISTLGYTNISVQWAAQKSSAYTAAVSLYYTINGGTTWTPVTFTDVQTNVTGNPWQLVNNGVAIKLPATANNQNSLQLKWRAYPSNTGAYYSMNDIGIYGLGKITDCNSATIPLNYVNTSCSAIQYSTASAVSANWTVWPSFSGATHVSLPTSGSTTSTVNLTVPSSTASGTYDVDVVVNDVNGNNSGVISFPVTVSPAIIAGAALDNCSCNNGSNYGNVVAVYATGGAGAFNFSATGTDVLETTIDATGTGYSGSSHSGVKGIFWSAIDGLTHTYNVSDGACSSTTTLVTQNAKPTTIPFGAYSGIPSAITGGLGGNGISGSYNHTGQGDPAISTATGSALTCHHTADFQSNWLTYQVNQLSGTTPVPGGAVVEIRNNGINLDSVEVSVYRDDALPAVVNAATHTTACAGYTGYAMERHFMIRSTKSKAGTPALGSFGNGVDVRLYFSDAEWQDLKYWTQTVAANATGLSAGCAQADVVNTPANLYVTKYTSPYADQHDEDGSYTNNSVSGLYRVFGANTTPALGNGPNTMDGGGTTIQTGNGSIAHYVQLNVTEFSEFWLGGSQSIEALPVEMIYLEAEAMNNDSIQVRWATALEVNNNHFNVERSTDGSSWQVIGAEAGHNSTTQQQNYVYNDLNVVPNVRYYYRLKQVDNNGNYQYTEVVQAMITGSGTFMVMNFVPNPSSGSTRLTVLTSKTQDITVDFYDMLGQKVSTYTEQLTAGNNRIDFDLSRFAAGTYSAVVTSDNQLYTKKLVITR